MLEIPNKTSGYLPVLRSFRTEIPLATNRHYKNLECHVNGTLPDEIREKLPIFGMPGFLKSEHYALNSGGRGILLSDGETHLRFKGCDINGSITNTVANARNNHISDIRTTAEEIAGIKFNTHSLDCGDVYEVPGYKGKPFSFFTQESVDNERRASLMLGDFYEKHGFARPYTFEAAIRYPTIQWHGKPCSTLVFSLPSLESDLRFEEIFRLGFLHLKFAAPEELQDLKQILGDFLDKLTTWYGFTTAAMEKNKLMHSIPSHQHQNFVLCHVTDTEIGAARVDHTSTTVNPHFYKTRIPNMRSEYNFFSTLQLSLLHALKLAEQKHQFNEQRYTGYFDVAYKWNKPMNMTDVPEFTEYLDIQKKSFEKGYKHKDPVPVQEKELIDIVEQIAAVRIDTERQKRVTAYMNLLMVKELIRQGDYSEEEFRKELRQIGMTPEQVESLFKH